MGTIAYLHPPLTEAGAQRLLDDVTKAKAAGIDLGDRRAPMRELTSELQINYGRLQQAIVHLKAIGGDRNPEICHQIRLSEAMCTDLLDKLAPLLQQAAAINACFAD